MSLKKQAIIKTLRRTLGAIGPSGLSAAKRERAKLVSEFSRKLSVPKSSYKSEFVDTSTEAIFKKLTNSDPKMAEAMIKDLQKSVQHANFIPNKPKPVGVSGVDIKNLMNSQSRVGEAGSESMVAKSVLGTGLFLGGTYGGIALRDRIKDKQNLRRGK